MTKEQYNEDPVYFCKECLSINIRFTREDIDYCDNCGSVDIDKTNIYTWIHFYTRKYGKPFLKLKK